MSDLEKFLQQAAQRMKERQQQAGGQPQRPQQPVQPPQQQQQPVRNQNRPPNRPPNRPIQPIAEAEIVDAMIVDNPRELGPDRLSSLDTRQAPGTTNVSMADERMASHVQQVFDHNLGQLSQAPPMRVPEPKASSQEKTKQKTEVSVQKQSVPWIIRLLQNPDTLRATFVASEIFKRRF